MASAGGSSGPTTSKSQRRAEENALILRQAMSKVAAEGRQMKLSIDQDDLNAVLKHAAGLLGELRTGLLHPKNYYELYMRVCDELHYLEGYFSTVSETRMSVVDLYQRVQHCGNVLPRLYLLSTVGSTYIKSQEAPAKDILKDLVEMTKGVQHPMRGLFLRYFLSQQTKDKLPDTGTEYEGEGGTVTDAIDFVLLNFCEMNRLWVRMQRSTSGKSKKKKRREKERQQLRILVGTNLVRLSQLEGVDLECYQTTVLPRVLEEVANCKDHIAQQYLMDCIIQVFPDDFHLQTLEPFLAGCLTLDEGVDVKRVLINLMERIINFVSDADSGGIPEDVPAFRLLNEYVARVIESKSAMELNDILELQGVLLQFASTCYPDDCLGYVDHILGFSAQALKRLVGADESLPSESVRLVVQLLTAPLEALSLATLQLEHYPSLLQQLAFEPRKKVAMRLLRAVVDANSTLGTTTIVEQLFTFISPLMRDGEDTPQFEEYDDASKAQFAAEQRLVGRLVPLMRHENDGELFRIYGIARRAFGKGGLQRIRYTLVSLVFAYIELSRRLKKSALAASAEADAAADGEDAGESKSAGGTIDAKSRKALRKVFQYIHEILTALAAVDEYQDIALHMFLQAVLAADAVPFESIAYDFVTKAFSLYEDTADSQLRFKALQQMVGTLHQTQNFSEENYDTLITSATKHAAKLVKKQDQCVLVCKCAHLFWTGRVDGGEPRYAQDGTALECLKRALRKAEKIIDEAVQAQLYVHILNEYLYFYAQECPSVETKYLSGLVVLCQEKFSELDNPNAPTARAAAEHFQATLEFIEARANGAGDAEPDARFAAIRRGN